MPCTYQSRTIRERFTDAKTLQKALARLDAYHRGRITVNGLTVSTRDDEALDALKQAYTTETHIKQAEENDFWVKETRQANGEIVLTVTA